MTRLDIAYTIVALIVAALLMYVMQKTEHDRINKVDSPRVQRFRRLSFIGSALILLYSIMSTDWQLSCLLLVGASGIILAVNAVALHMRTPPSNGSRIPSFSASQFFASLRSYFSPH